MKLFTNNYGPKTEPRSAESADSLIESTPHPSAKLYDAIDNNRPEDFKQALEAGFDLTVPPEHQREQATPITYAILKNNTGVLFYLKLLEAIILTEVDAGGRTPIIAAGYAGATRLISELLKDLSEDVKPLHMKMRDDNWRTPILAAAFQNKEMAVQQLSYKYNFDLTAFDKLGHDVLCYTLMHTDAKSNDFDLLKLLLNKNKLRLFRPNKQNGNIPIKYFSLLENEADLIDFFIKIQIDPTQKCIADAFIQEAKDVLKGHISNEITDPDDICHLEECARQISNAFEHSQDKRKALAALAASYTGTTKNINALLKELTEASSKSELPPSDSNPAEFEKKEADTTSFRSSILKH